MIDLAARPFCSQPWSTFYVQWDGKLTRPCIRGPQNLGSLEGESAEKFWHGPAFSAIRAEVRSGANLNEACGGCFADRRRLIDHMTPFEDNLASFDYEKLDNYYHAMGEHERGTTSITSKPVVLVLDLSSKCHIRCPKCFVYNSTDVQAGNYHLGHMTMETFNKLVPLLRTALMVVGHENGESMLNKNFMRMVEIIKENKCRFLFNTTGLLLTPDKNRFLVDKRIERIMLSIDSIDPALYKKMHKGGQLADLMRNLDDLNCAKRQARSPLPGLGWYFVASRSNLGELPAIMDRAAELGFDSMYISPLNQPTREQGRSYFDYYRTENMVRSADDRAVFYAAIEQARALAATKNIRMYS